jgi:phospholipid-translocating ATPase
LVHHIYAKRFSIRLGRPDVAVQDVKGVISAESHSEAPLALTNYLPRGCVLRNTSWALAIVGYVGDDTKTRLNSSKSKPKVSNMQKYLNMCVWGLLVCLFILCIFAATMRVIQFDEFAFLL